MQSTESIHNGAFSPILDRQIDEITAGLMPSYVKALRTLSEENIKTIVASIFSARTETNCSDHYRRDMIEALTRFAKYNPMIFMDITRDDIISFLESFRKTETQDPLHRWVGTYNIYRIHLLRFFKWLYYPSMEPAGRVKPPILENIPMLKRKEISCYKPSDMWTPQDDLLFLKYCPSKRDKCYHAMSRDLSCRPSEILRLKIKDAVFRTIGSSQYVQVVVNGKTGTRSIPLINSIPYFKDYIDHEHPQPSNYNSPLISGIGKSLGRHLTPIGIAMTYLKYKTKVFPKILESPNVLPEDKQKITELLKKPWNPYVRRHSALTEKARMLKEPILKMHAGWSPRSQMHLKYEHWFGNESNESLLEAYGLIDHGIQINQLSPKQCPNCTEPNKVDSKFCAKCRMCLSYDAYAETLEDQKKKESEVEMLTERYEQDMKSMKQDMNKQFNLVMEMIQQNPQLAQVKPEVLTRKK